MGNLLNTVLPMTNRVTQANKGGGGITNSGSLPPQILTQQIYLSDEQTEMGKDGQEKWGVKESYIVPRAPHSAS